MKNLILMTGMRGRVGLELAKTFNDAGFEVVPLLNDSTYSQYFLPNASDLSNYKNVFVVHSGQPNAPRSRLQRRRYLLASKNLIEESKSRNIKFVFISSLSAHNDNQSNYSKEKLFLEKLTEYNSGSVIKLGVVTGIAESYTFRISNIQKILSYVGLDYLITSVPMYFTSVELLGNISTFLQNEDSWGGVKSVFDDGTKTEMTLGFFKDSFRNALVLFLLLLSKSGSGRADALLSLIAGMRAPR